jgi:uncharacterized protein
MKWERGHKSRHVEDRRGRPGARAATIGGGAAIIAALAALIGSALGVDVTGMFGGGSSTSAPAEEPVGLDPNADPDRELFDFVNYVIDDIQDTFADKLRADRHAYEHATLVVFKAATDTGCGVGEAAIGPFYCPPDHKAYVDLSFYKVLKDRLGAGGDFAQAYVLAHEIGHHVQTLLGTNERVRRDSAREPKRANDLSVRQELQADCYAGVWAHSTERRNLLDRGDIQESVEAAAAIGDDRLQKMSGRKVNPETWTHGSSAQRVRWFKKGYERGVMADCDTFAARDL